MAAPVDGTARGQRFVNCLGLLFNSSNSDILLCPEAGGRAFEQEVSPIGSLVFLRRDNSVDAILDAGASQLLAVKFARAVTAIISLWAVAELIPWVPQMLALAGAASLPANTALLTQKVDRPQADSAIKNSLPSPTTEIQQINQQLLSEIIQRQRVEDILLDTVDKLQESQERFRVFQELSLDGFNVFRSIRDESKIVDFEWEYVNPAAAKIQHVPLKH